MKLRAKKFLGMVLAILILTSGAWAFDEEVLSLASTATAYLPKIGEFEYIEMTVVYSTTDVDAQILIGCEGNEPIKRILVYGPDNKLFLNAKGFDNQKIGWADIQFDTPEPYLEELMQAYPEGTYKFKAHTIYGEILVGEVELSYDLLDAPYFTYPQEGSTDIPITNLVVTWDPIDGAEAIRFEIEDEKEEVTVKIELPGDATNVNLPENWLKPGTEYTADIKAFGENGNITVTDIRFQTAE